MVKRRNPYVKLLGLENRGPLSPSVGSCDSLADVANGTQRYPIIGTLRDSNPGGYPEPALISSP